MKSETKVDEIDNVIDLSRERQRRRSPRIISYLVQDGEITDLKRFGEDGEEL